MAGQIHRLVQDAEDYHGVAVVAGLLQPPGLPGEGVGGVSARPAADAAGKWRRPSRTTSLALINSGHRCAGATHLLALPVVYRDIWPRLPSGRAPDATRPTRDQGDTVAQVLYQLRVINPRSAYWILPWPGIMPYVASRPIGGSPCVACCPALPPCPCWPSSRRTLNSTACSRRSGRSSKWPRFAANSWCWPPAAARTSATTPLSASTRPT